MRTLSEVILSVWDRYAFRWGVLPVDVRIELTRVRRVVFVCKGNVCRSVYAEFRARAVGLAAVSAGLQTTGQVPANRDAVRVAADRGLNLASHASRQFDDIVGSLDESDLVVVMEPWQARLVRHACVEHKAQVTIAGLWLPIPRAVIDDPYGREDATFARVFDDLDRVVAALSKAADLSAKGMTTSHLVRPD